MRSVNQKTFVLLVVLLALVSACNVNHGYVQTQVFPNGSIQQYLRIEVDSARFIPYSCTIDTSWHNVIPLNDSQIVVTKNYPSSQLLNQEFGPITDSTLAFHTTVQKQFAWFYTRYTYTTVLFKLDSLAPLPYRKYFSNEDIDFMSRYSSDSVAISHNDSLVKRRIDNGTYYQDMFFDVYSAGLLRSLKDLGLSEKYQEPWQTEMQNIKHQWGAESKFDAQSFMQVVEDKLGTPDIRIADSLMYRYAQPYQTLVNKALKLATISHQFSAILPGQLVHTNALVQRGDTLYWTPDILINCLVLNHALSAQSRITHPWAYALTAFGVLGVLFLLFRRKSRNH